MKIWAKFIPWLECVKKTGFILPSKFRVQTERQHRIWPNHLTTDWWFYRFDPLWWMILIYVMPFYKWVPNMQHAFYTMYSWHKTWTDEMCIAWMLLKIQYPMRMRMLDPQWWAPLWFGQNNLRNHPGILVEVIWKMEITKSRKWILWNTLWWSRIWIQVTSNDNEI